MSVVALDCFSATYAVARARLLEAATSAGAGGRACMEPGLGAQGEPLALDVIRAGPDDAQWAVMVTSGCHGVEGHAGSAAQIGVLQDRRLLARLEAGGVALLIFHALNPFGFSFSRRSTAENVDLNRNGVAFDRPLPENPGYRDLHALLVPPVWPSPHATERALAAAIDRHGLRGFQDIVTRGQYDFEHGLFYGGRAATWSHRALREMLRQSTSSMRCIAWIDLHTGLGPCGVGESIFTGGATACAETSARAWWGNVTRTDDGTAASTSLTGTLPSIVQQELGDRLVTSITLEFGTVSPMEVMSALRFDAVAHQNDADSMRWRPRAAGAMREAFFVDTPGWKSAVFEQAVDSIDAAVRGMTRLRRDRPA